MPIAKRRSVEEAVPPSARPLDGDNLRAAIEISDLCLRLYPLVPPRGVRRFGSIEEAQDHRRCWESEQRKA